MRLIFPTSKFDAMLFVYERLKYTVKHLNVMYLLKVCVIDWFCNIFKIYASYWAAVYTSSSFILHIDLFYLSINCWDKYMWYYTFYFRMPGKLCPWELNCSCLSIFLLSLLAGCSALCVLCPKWILQIWSCLQIWSPNWYTRIQFICYAPIWHANGSLSYRLPCCRVGSIFIFPQCKGGLYFHQRPICQPSSITSVSTWACQHNLAKRGFPSRHYHASSDFYYRWRQFKPCWWSLIFSELRGVILSAQFFLTQVG
jgi:hypothetical protein